MNIHDVENVIEIIPAQNLKSYDCKNWKETYSLYEIL